jgi:hypothetical protein
MGITLPYHNHTHAPNDSRSLVSSLDASSSALLLLDVLTLCVVAASHFLGVQFSPGVPTQLLSVALGVPCAQEVWKLFRYLRDSGVVLSPDAYRASLKVCVCVCVCVCLER